MRQGLKKLFLNGVFMKKNRNLETDFLDFVQLCKKHEVKYLVIGGFAVSVHGYPRYTKDLDI